MSLDTRSLHNIKSKETLEMILKLCQNRERVAYCRFGDGDLELARNKNSGTHRPNGKMGKELRESFAIVHPNYLRTLPLAHKIYNGKESHMYKKYDCLGYCNKVFKMAVNVWGGGIYDTPIYSAVAPMYLAQKDPEYLADFLDKLTSCGDRVILVGNEENTLDQLQPIFYHRVTDFIKTPNQESYKEIKRIWKELIGIMKPYQDKYLVIIGFLGNTGRVLCKRLWQTEYNFVYFDFSSLMDVLCGGACRGRSWYSQDRKNPRIAQGLMDKILARQ
jgi:hypothetical protein